LGNVRGTRVISGLKREKETEKRDKENLGTRVTSLPVLPNLFLDTIGKISDTREDIFT
jgi:hypothetical protein